jgi:hypothetical protein
MTMKHSMKQRKMSVESMMKDYEAILDRVKLKGEFDEIEEDQKVRQTVVLDSSVVGLLNDIVAYYSKEGVSFVSRTSLMNNFIVSCAVDLGARLGLHKGENEDEEAA